MKNDKSGGVDYRQMKKTNQKNKNVLNIEGLK